MSNGREIDDRVVSIEFDNSNFSDNVDDTLNSLSALEEKLKFKNVQDSFSRITQSASNVSLAGITEGVEFLQRRFSTMGIVGMRVVERLTDSMINLASKGIGFLTDSIIEGGKRRAMNLENAKFTLDGLLKDDAKVAAVMQNVQDSVDGTAYGLDAAAVVASQLTASGMEAGDEMLHSLKAIAGVAAMTNSDFSEIGHIFTTIAGNGKVMSEQLNQFSYRGLNAAATLGEQMGKTEQEIRDMVSKGKISFKEFSEAMNDAFGEHAKKANETFTGAMSNVKSALGRIGAKFITPLVERNGPVVQVLNALRLQINSFNALLDPFVKKYVNVVNSVSQFLVKGLNNFDKSGASVRLLIEPLQILQNIFTALWSVLKPIGQAFNDVFGGTHTEQLMQLINGIKNLTKGMILTGAQGIKLRNVFKGIFSVVDGVVSVIFDVVNGIVETVRSYDGAFEGFLTALSNIGESVFNFVQKLKEMGILKTIIQGVVTVLSGFGKVLASTTEVIKNITAGDAFRVLGMVWNGVSTTFAKATAVIRDCIAVVGKAFADLVRSGDAQSIMDLLNSGILMSLFSRLKNITLNLTDGMKIFTQFWDGMRIKFGGLNSLFFSLRNTINAFTMSINYKTLWEIAKSLGVLAVSCLILAQVPKEELSRALSAITMMMIVLTACFGKLMATPAGMFRNAGALFGILKFAEAVLLLAFAFAKIANTIGDNPDTWIQALVALFAMVVMMTGVADYMARHKIKMFGTGGFIKIAIALVIMAKAFESLGNLTNDQMLHGLEGMAACVAVMWAIMAIMSSKGVNMFKVAANARAFLVISAALRVMAGVMKLVGDLSDEELTKSLGGLIAIVAIMGLFAKVMTDDRTIALLEAAGSIVLMAESLESVADIAVMIGHMKWTELAKAGTFLAGFFGIVSLWAVICNLLSGKAKSAMFTAAGALIVFGVAIKIMAKVVKQFADIEWSTVGKAVTGIGGLVAVLLIFSLLGKNHTAAIISSAEAMVVFGVAARIIAGVVKVFDGISWGGIGRAAVGVGSLVAIMFVMGKVIGKPGMAKNVLVAAGCIAALGVALTIMAPALTVLGTIGILGATGGLIGIGIGMAIIGAAARQFATAIPAMFGFAGVLVVLSLALTVASIGLSTLATTVIRFTAMSEEEAERATKAIKKVLAGLAIIITVMAVFAYLGVTSGVFATMIPIMLEFAAVALILAAALGVISLSFIAIAVAVKKFAEVTEDEAEAAGKSFLKVIDSFGDGIKEFLKKSAEGILTFFETIFEAGPEFFSSLKDFLISMLETIAEVAPEIARVIVSVLLEVLDLVAENAPTIFAKLWDIVLSLLDSLSNSVDSLVDKVFEIIQKVLDRVAETGADVLGDIAETIGKTLGDLIGEIIGGLVNGIIQGASSAIAESGDDLSLFGDHLKSFLEILKSFDESAVTGAKNLITLITSLGNAGLLAFLEQFADAILFGTLSKALKETITLLGDMLIAFSDSISGLSDADVAKINVASNALVKIKDMTGYLKEIKSLDGTEADGFLSDLDSLTTANIQSTFTSAVSTAETELQKLKPKMIEIGKNCVDGFVEGLTDARNVLKVQNASFELGKVAETAVRNAVDVNSPSRKFRSVGNSCGEGMVLGLEDGASDVEKAAAGIGFAAISGTKSLASRIQALMESGDATPIITPVLDLSQIQNGTSDIDRMFNNPSVGFTATFNAKNEETNTHLIEQNNLLRQMIAAINAGGNVYIKDGPLIGYIDTKLGGRV